jgi:hypothetical protein
VTCATHVHIFSNARSSHAANASAFDVVCCMRLPTAVLPARAAVEAPDQDLVWGSDRVAHVRKSQHVREVATDGMHHPRFVIDGGFLIDDLARRSGARWSTR